MRKLIVSEFITLDGVIEDPGGAEKTKYGGWSLKFWSDEYSRYKFDELFSADALLLGRVTYEGFAEAWPSRTDESGFADRMNKIPKYVVSTTLKESEWNNSHIINNNIADEISWLKEQWGRDILVAGSGKLTRSLIKLNLIDEFRLMVFPVVLGEGKRLFDGTDMMKLKLIDMIRFETGVMVMHYQPNNE